MLNALADPSSKWPKTAAMTWASPPCCTGGTPRGASRAPGSQRHRAASQSTQGAHRGRARPRAARQSTHRRRKSATRISHQPSSPRGRRLRMRAPPQARSGTPAVQAAGKSWACLRRRAWRCNGLRSMPGRPPGRGGSAAPSSSTAPSRCRHPCCGAALRGSGPAGLPKTGSRPPRRKCPPGSSARGCARRRWHEPRRRRCSVSRGRPRRLAAATRRGPRTGPRRERSSRSSPRSRRPHCRTRGRQRRRPRSAGSSRRSRAATGPGWASRRPWRRRAGPAGRTRPAGRTSRRARRRDQRGPPRRHSGPRSAGRWPLDRRSRTGSPTAHGSRRSCWAW
mmetsp:Transcript_69902/g.193263  ORF Transcript_69902/g.193263 Transcript_69902/m.193263 type:complete len:337 (-) Transcript_69902:252-1262(-)